MSVEGDARLYADRGPNFELERLELGLRVALYLERSRILHG